MTTFPLIPPQSTDLRGGPLTKAIRAEVAEAVSALRTTGVEPRLAVVLATADAAARSYAQAKRKGATALGIEVELVELGAETSQAELEARLTALSDRADVHGVLLELPLAPGLDSGRALDRIARHKDVDGLTPANLGLVMAGREAEAITPTTPQACISLAETLGSLAGKRVAVVGRGRTVGRPLVGMLLNRDATPTICHTRTHDLRGALADCQVVVVAAGKAGLLTAEDFSPGQIVIDAGINVVGEALVGDVNPEGVREKGVALTPVPGGVGAVTSALVFRNLVRAIRLAQENPRP